MVIDATVQVGMIVLMNNRGVGTMDIHDENKPATCTRGR